MYENGLSRDHEYAYQQALLKRDTLLRSIAFCHEKIGYYSALKRAEKLVHAWQETLAQEKDRLEELRKQFPGLEDNA